MHRCPDCGSPHVIKKHGRGSQSRDPDRPRGEPYDPAQRDVEAVPEIALFPADGAPKSIEDLDL